MPTQNLFIAHPSTAEQVKALKAFVKALNIKFEITSTETPYNQEFVDKILQGDKDFKDGKGKKITVDELNALWK